MFEVFDNLTQEESKEMLEAHPELAYISIDQELDDGEHVEVKQLLAVADMDGLETLLTVINLIEVQGEILSIDLSPLGIQPMFDDDI